MRWRVGMRWRDEVDGGEVRDEVEGGEVREG